MAASERRTETPFEDEIRTWILDVMDDDAERGGDNARPRPAAPLRPARGPQTPRRPARRR